MTHPLPQLKLLPYGQYKGVNADDPIKYYYWPVFGPMYRRRVEMCLGECRGGQRVLEVGFGTGLAFLNLAEMYDEIYGIDLTASIPEVQSVFEPLGIHADLREGSVLAMPYADETFDTVLLISILEHLKPHELAQAFREIWRVLKPGGQVVYGAPVERTFMVFMFRLLGHDIRREHFSTEKDIAAAAEQVFKKERLLEMTSLAGPVYNVGHFVKA